ncbi:FliI/YscN family ATPase [Sphingosinithalassobacter portus]|uniref:FliI/YscN family ATPase n=1 Tax=Stakelama portus TaxID=2676234 RepID=UPI000D6E1E4F|nr:FliI/YscN family ATPase [Sphingosinithalassobacter portus]
MLKRRYLDLLDSAELLRPFAVVRATTASRFEASGPDCAVGDLCEIIASDAPTEAVAIAEVVAISESGVVLTPVRTIRQVRPGDRVFRLRSGGDVAVGQAFAGRAINPLGEAIDGGAPLIPDALVPRGGVSASPLDRVGPTSVVPTGIRAIDGLLTLGMGQRVGIFAASGVGKTSLIEQLSSQIACDRCILCLVGERGREVEGIWGMVAGRNDASRFTMVAATSDDSAALRARAVDVALCLAEHWRDRGEHVLFIADSVTRLAMALREIGLSAGEPPTVRAYTPNVFAALPRLVERCGARRRSGAITAIMTILSETDEVDDPITETMKSLLDGHIVLSRTLAERGHFPAIDIARSISRQAERIIEPGHRDAARAALRILSIYEESRVLIESGVYRPGSNPETDAALAARPALLQFLQQRWDERIDFATAIPALRHAVAGAQHE